MQYETMRVPYLRGKNQVVSHSYDKKNVNDEFVQCGLIPEQA